MIQTSVSVAYVASIIQDQDSGIGAPVCVRSGGVGSMGAWLRPRPT